LFFTSDKLIHLLFLSDRRGHPGWCWCPCCWLLCIQSAQQQCRRGMLRFYCHLRQTRRSVSLQKKAHAWSYNNWLKDAEQRTRAFRSGNYPGPVAWVLNEGKYIPPDAIEGGFERGAPLYICRAYYEASTTVVLLD